MSDVTPVTPEVTDEPIITEEKASEKIKKKKKRMPGWLRTMIILLVIAGVFAGGFFVWGSFNTKGAESMYNEITVERGTISNQVSGSGTIEAVSQHEITALIKGEIMSADFEEGQMVKKGDILYRIETKDVESNIESSKLALERAQDTYDKEVKKNNETAAKLTIKAEHSGVVTNTYVKNGDKVQDKAKIADVVDSSIMLLTVPFISEQADQLYSGQSVHISMTNSSNKLNGKVKRVYTGETVSADGITVKNVEISVDNPGSIRQGDKATAIVGNIACNDIGTFDDLETFSIYAETAGDIYSFNKKVGDKISAGEVVAKIKNDDIDDSIKSNEISLKDAKLKLQNQYDQLDNYNITSPIDGTIIQKNAKEGDVIGGSEQKDVMAIVADMSKIVFKLNIDELDIEKIQVDQKVDITADAMPDKKFTGYVEYKSIVGESSNGVTSYPVTVVVNEPGGLIPGMNVNAVIVVESKDDVVRIPVSALNRGNMVFVKGDVTDEPQGEGQGGQGGNQPQGVRIREGQQGDGQGQPRQGAQGQNPQGQQGATQNAQGEGQQGGQMRVMGMQNMLPEGAKPIIVQTGISDKDYIEITSGLKAGDIIYVRKQETATTNTSPNMMRMPGGGGAMPAGGGGGTMIIREGGSGGGAAGGTRR